MRRSSVRRSRTATGGGSSPPAFLHAGILHIALQHVRAVHPRHPARAGDRHAAVPGRLLRLAARGLVRGPPAEPERAHGRRLGGDLRAHVGRRSSSPVTAGSSSSPARSRFFIIINLLFTLGVSGISVGGHLGGLVGGAPGRAFDRLRRAPRPPSRGARGCSGCSRWQRSAWSGALRSPRSSGAPGGRGELAPAEALRLLHAVRVEQVAEQLGAVDQAGPRPRERAGRVHRDEPPRAEPPRAARRRASACFAASSTYRPQGIATTTSARGPGELLPARGAGVDPRLAGHAGAPGDVDHLGHPVTADVGRVEPLEGKDPRGAPPRCTASRSRPSRASRRARSSTPRLGRRRRRRA